MIARLRRLRDDESGMSITELVVTMFVTGILLAIVASMFLNVARVTANSNASNQRSSVAANIMEGITKVIRTATNVDVSTSDTPDPAIVAATAKSLTIYTYVDLKVEDYVNTPTSTPPPTKVVYRVDASGNLLEDRYSSALSGGFWIFSSTAITRTVGGPVQTLTGDDALFVYLDSGNKAMIPGADGLSLIQRSSVSSVRVNVRILNALTTGADPIVVQNTIGMPNLKLSRTDT